MSLSPSCKCCPALTLFKLKGASPIWASPIHDEASEQYLSHLVVTLYAPLRLLPAFISFSGSSEARFGQAVSNDSWVLSAFHCAKFTRLYCVTTRGDPCWSPGRCLVSCWDLTWSSLALKFSRQSESQSKVLPTPLAQWLATWLKAWYCAGEPAVIFVEEPDGSSMGVIATQEELLALMDRLNQKGLRERPLYQALQKRYELMLATLGQRAVNLDVQRTSRCRLFSIFALQGYNELYPYASRKLMWSIVMQKPCLERLTMSLMRLWSVRHNAVAFTLQCDYKLCSAN